MHLDAIALSLYDLHPFAFVYAPMWLFAPIIFVAFPVSYPLWKMTMNQGDGLVNDE